MKRKQVSAGLGKAGASARVLLASALRPLGLMAFGLRADGYGLED